MKNKEIKILAIETSCDETAAAVIGMNKSGRPTILSNVVSSQIDLHAKTGGIVPEVASRAHIEAIIPVIAEALIESSNAGSFLSGRDDNNVEADLNSKITIERYNNAISLLQKEITHIAYTAGPGLIGSLLVGYNAAKAMAYSLNLPIIPINHIEGHIYSAFTEEPVGEIDFPILSLTVSGGHTSLTLMKDHGDYETIGETLDDAAGEAFDKVAKLLGLGYPGGPIISKYAQEFRQNSKNKTQNTNPIIFPRPILNDGTFNFSFSGLKTAVLQKVIDLKKEGKLSNETKQEIAAAFEDATADVLITKTIRAAKKYSPKTIILAGGVAANSFLRTSLQKFVVEEMPEVDLIIPLLKYCGDNATMIGLAAFYHIKRNDLSTWREVKVDSNLDL